jgi:AmmeMemoRadiSam system protein A
MLNPDQKKEILKLARNTIVNYVEKGIITRYATDDEALKQHDGAFVTIHKSGMLRGCIGMIESDNMLFETIIEMAIESSTADPRFEPLSPDELNEIEIEVSVLFPKKRIKSIDEIEMGKHGVIVKRGLASGVFLPQVATETGWSKQEFMRNLCEGKAGIEPDCYEDPGTEIYIFEADVFGEKKDIRKGK